MDQLPLCDSAKDILSENYFTRFSSNVFSSVKADVNSNKQHLIILKSSDS